MAKGSLSTHVLDTTTGKPATGVQVELQRDGQVIASGVTDADGRIRELGRDLDAGRYRLIFDTKSYLAEPRSGGHAPETSELGGLTPEASEPGGHAPETYFFSRVALDVDLGATHTHVPLLLSRFGVTSYRGS